MLVLARKTNEAIQIGANITVKVLRVKGKAVKLGIKAPDNVEVVRTELLVRSGGADTGSEVVPGASETHSSGESQPVEKPLREDSGSTASEEASRDGGRVALHAARRLSRLARPKPAPVGAC